MIGLLIAAVAVGYVVSLWLWPFQPCRSCGGKGHVQRLGSRTVAQAIRAGRSRSQ